MPLPGLRPEEGAPSGQQFHRRVGHRADQFGRHSGLPYNPNPLAPILELKHMGSILNPQFAIH